MVLAAALGLAGPAFEDGWGLPAVDRTRVALVAVRSLDEGERLLLQELDAKVFTMSDVDRIGIERVVREALAHVAGPGFVHVSIDMDAVDPDYAPGVGTPGSRVGAPGAPPTREGPVMNHFRANCGPLARRLRCRDVRSPAIAPLVRR